MTSPGARKCPALLCLLCLLWLDSFETDGAAEGGDEDRGVTRTADGRDAAQNIRPRHSRVFNHDRRDHWPSPGRGWSLYRTWRLALCGRRWRRRFIKIFQRKIGNYVVL